MPTVVDAPNGIGAENDWGDFAGSRPTNVATNDGDTTGIFKEATFGVRRRQLFTFPSLPSDFNTLTSAKATAVMKKYTGTVYVFTHYAGSDADYGAIGGTYTAYDSLSVTSGSKATVEAYHGGPGAQQTGGNEVWCTLVYRTVVYSAASGACFSTTLGSLVGVGVGLAEFFRACAMANVLEKEKFLLGAPRATLILTGEVPNLFTSFASRKHLVMV
jgi:hypothetical protein